VAIDAKRSATSQQWEAFTRGGRNASGVNAVSWAREAERCGAGRDSAHFHGSRRHGIRFRLRIDQSGCGLRTHPCHRFGRCRWRRNIFCKSFATATPMPALAASIFHYGIGRLADLKERLRSEGVPVRLPC